MYAFGASAGSPTPRSPSLGLKSDHGPNRLHQWAFVSLVAGLAAAGVRAGVSFDHGIWLIAYLLLVGFLAPLALGSTQEALLEGRSETGGTARQALFWAFGTVVVPAGVLLNSRLIVMLGAAALILALRWIAISAKGSIVRSRRRALVYAHFGLVSFMTTSVVVGVILAWDSPWY